MPAPVLSILRRAAIVAALLFGMAQAMAVGYLKGQHDADPQHPLAVYARDLCADRPDLADECRAFRDSPTLPRAYGVTSRAE